LAEHKQRLSSNPLQNVKPKNFSDVYVPLGLVKRGQKERPRLDRDLDPSADRGSELCHVETTPINHDDFLTAVHARQPGEHIVILGEPGAGKTTLLTKVWDSLLAKVNAETPMIVAWVPLAALKNQDLAEYLKNVWLKQVCPKVSPTLEEINTYWQSFEALVEQKRVWLLLDGADEMGGDGLAKIQTIFQQSWTKSIRAIITCRLNLWDGSARNELKQNFQIFRTLDFKYANSTGQDEVAAFIGKWFDDGRKDLENKLKKDEFIEKLTNFQAGCGNSMYHYFLAYRIAVIGVGEFNSSQRESI
jgi:predicted NACHT family NTPase